MGIRIAKISIILLFFGHQVFADDTNERWKHFYETIAKKYSIEMVGEEPQPLTLSSYPALLWSNPARVGDTHGAFWVWTDSGRPKAVGTIFSYTGGSGRVVAHEFHSLSQLPLRAKLNDRVVWKPEENGIEWKELEGTGEPAATRTRRLTQMRAIAREFVVTAQNEVGQGDGDQTMRLLDQPLYRYETENEVLDGALFTFVLGTDPECLLVVESDMEKKSWKIAVARFTHLSFQVNRKGKLLFEHIRGTETETNSSFRYVCFRNGSAPLTPPPITEKAEE